MIDNRLVKVAIECVHISHILTFCQKKRFSAALHFLAGSRQFREVSLAGGGSAWKVHAAAGRVIRILPKWAAR